MTSEPGVSDDEIVLGTHTSLTGPLAAYGEVALAARAVFDEANARGGVHGRRIRLEIRDDGYDPARASAAVRALVRDVGVLAIVMGSGTPTHLAVADALAAEGVPDLWVVSGSQRMLEPRRAGLFTANVSYARMAACLGGHLRALGVPRAGVLVQRSAVGDELLEGLRTPQASDHEAAAMPGQQVTLAARRGPVLVELRHDLDASLRTDVERCAAERLPAALCMATPPQVAEAISHGRALGWRPRWITVFTDGLVDMLGADAEGLVSCHWLALPEGDSGPAMLAHAALVRRRAPEVAITGTSVGGHVLAEATLEVLRRAGPHPTRAGVIAAAESLAGWRSPLALVPATCSASDHALFGDAALLVVRGGRWVPYETDALA